MSIELGKPVRQQAVASIERYFLEHMDERTGNVAAEGLLNFFLKEVGPSIYNQAVADAQSRLQARVMELGPVNTIFPSANGLKTAPIQVRDDGQTRGLA